MNVINKILTYIAIVCVLIMATMGIVSAGSWTPPNTDSGQIYCPYVPIDYLRITSEVGAEYVLNVNDVFSTYSDLSAGGASRELLLDFVSDGENKSVLCQVSVTPSTSTNNLIYQIDIPINNLGDGSSFDAPYIDIHSSDFIVSNQCLNSQWLPQVYFRGPNNSYPRFSMTCDAAVSYVGELISSNGTSHEFLTDNNFHYSYSGLDNTDGRTSAYRITQMFTAASSRSETDSNLYNKYYLSKYNSTSDAMLVEEYNTHISFNDEVSLVRLSIPYTFSPLTFKQYVNGFNLDSGTIVETSYVTSVVTSFVVGDFEDQYVSFTDWLVLAVGGFLDFGFWGISIAGILGVIISFKLVKMLLDFFSGG